MTTTHQDNCPHCGLLVDPVDPNPGDDWYRYECDCNGHVAWNMTRPEVTA